MRRWQGGVGLVAAAALSAGAFSPPAANAQAPPKLSHFCFTGSVAGQCRIPRGIAVEPSNGQVYVADSVNHRVDVFTPWGGFVRTWGWDVVLSGPGDDTAAPEDEFEICVPAEGDECKTASAGSGAGQFGSGPTSPIGIALDGVGDIYVVDHGDSPSNRRVQKFGPDGDFILMFGGEVNKTKIDEGTASEAEENLCPVDPGDECQAGSEGTGNGQFGPLAFGSFIASSPDGETIYVGDEERIQEFGTNGEYLGDLPDPEGLLAGMTVQSLAVGPSGSLFIARCLSTALNCSGNTLPGPGDPGGDSVLKLGPSGNLKCALKGIVRPNALAVDANGEGYAVGARVPGTPPPAIMEIVEFNGSSCNETNRWNAEEEGFSVSTGIATSSACGLDELEPKGVDLFISNSDGSNSFVGLYGPPPDPDICPPLEVPPTIADQFATQVGASGATVRAQINPHFWPDTRYFVQYATAACVEAEGWEAPCVEEEPASPGDLLTEAVLDEAIPTAGVFLAGLEPDTAYRFRFAAASSGGGPVFGADAGFRTYAPALPAKTDCANQPFRSGLGALLAECRAYEMVSPPDKESGEIATAGDAVLQLSDPSGQRATFTSVRSFGDPEGAPLASQYLASRKAGGWSTESIAPPRSSVGLYWVGAIAYFQQYKAFSEDLCSGWVQQDSDLILLPGAPEGVPNSYRRDFRTCGTDRYELITTVHPPGFSLEAEEGESDYFPEIQGRSADSRHTLVRADAALTPDACVETTEDEGKVIVEEGKGLFQVYLHTAAPSMEGTEGQLRLVSTLPGGAPACVHSSGGTNQGILGELHQGSVAGALAADGSRAYWSTGENVNNQVPYSGGSGDQSGPLYLRLNPSEPQSAFATATGIGDLVNNSEVIGGLEPAGPDPFEVGQLISGPGIPAETKIVAVAPSSLTISRKATATKFNAALEAKSCKEPAKACTHLISEATNSRFWGASTNGEHAIYTAGSGLFEYDSEALASTPIAAEGVEGVMGMSADAARVYFVSTADLTGAQANSEGEVAAAGAHNLYLRERGAGITFVGRLGADDVRNEALASVPPSPIATLPDRRTARVTPDGAHAAFLSTAELTGFASTDSASGEPAAQLFLYDAEAGAPGELRCVSCNPTGARPRGRALKTGTNPLWAAARIPGWAYQLAPSRPLSEDGERLFFESFEALLLRDTNGQKDVYEWLRAASRAECVKAGAELYSPEAGGCISLVSAGKSSVDSHFIDASADGSDVFFSTTSSLTGHDVDEGLIDVYDARIGGGFPPPSPPEPGCEGEACQPYTPPPGPPTPGSSAFRGAGNPPVTGPSCAPAARKARRLARRAKAMRRKAERARGKRRSQAMRRKARRASRGARRHSNRAKRCRKGARAERRAAR